MSRKTFYGGVHPPGNKHRTSSVPIRKAALPKKVVIPLAQHTGSPCEAAVAVNDEVKTGSVLGKASGFISSPVHASISGKVKKITHMPHPVFSRALAVVIENDGVREEEVFIPRRNDEIESLSKEALLEIVKNSGIVGLGGAAFPTHVKLSPPESKPVDTFLLNGAECEPYLTCDERLMIERADDILKGLAIICKILGVNDACIAIENNKPLAIEAIRKALLSTKYEILSAKLVVLPTKYPQGAEKQLIRSVLNRVVPEGGLPMDVGCVVNNVGTALAVYEAVYKGKALIERCVTVSGGCVKEPANLQVRIGTLVSSLIEELGGLNEPPAKVIFGGPMMGIAQYTMDVPVVKGTSGILFLSKAEAADAAESVCIRCSRCVQVCPAGIMPTTIANLVKRTRFTEAKEFGITQCIECGACVYECPAKIPLLDYIKFGKSKLIVKK